MPTSIDPRSRHAVAIHFSTMSRPNSASRPPRPTSQSAAAQSQLHLALAPHEPTLNKSGFSFLQIPHEIHYWLTSLPQSRRPLLDIGAAYGVHTLHALSSPRDVIALDSHAPHLAILRARTRRLLADAAAATTPVGRLRRTVVATVPDETVLPARSVAGVWMSEMLHFLRPAVVQRVFDDVFRWLEPGGRFVTLSVSAMGLEDGVKRFGFRLRGGRALEDVLKLYAKGDRELIDGAPGYVTFADGHPLFKSTPGFMYLLSTREVGIYARRAGFVVEKTAYVRSSKYWTENAENKGNGTVLLVARKPG